MSWAEIKKAVNSDLSTPLDELLKNTTYGLSAIKNAIDAISTGGTVKIVKSVQRGQVSSSGSVYISTVNTNKSICIITGGSNSGSQYASGIGYATGYIQSSNQIYILLQSGQANITINPLAYWQVIEFY